MNDLMERTKEATIKLIDLFRDNEVLQSSRHKDYENCQLKYKAFIHIASNLNAEKDFVEKKIKGCSSLRIASSLGFSVFAKRVDN